MNRLPRTVRLDVSDESVFDRAALPGEWAVAGGFLFIGRADEAMAAAEHNALACGFLGVESFGWSTLVSVEPAGEAEVAATIETLARHFLRDLGAPSLAEARAVAAEEVRFAAGLCEGHAPGTLLTVARRFEDGEVVERYATLTPTDHLAAAHAAPIDLRALAALGDGA